MRARAAAVLALLVMLAACGGTKSPVGNPATSAPTFVDLTAKQIIDAAIADAKKMMSVHLDGTLTYGQLVLHAVGDAGTNVGKQRVTAGAIDVTLLLADKVLYVRGSAAGIGLFANLTDAAAAKYANKWLSFRAGNKYYADTVRGLDIATTSDDFALTSPVKGVVSTIAGTHVIAVSGIGSNKDPETLYISVNSPHLVVQDRLMGKDAKGSATYSRWGEPVTVVAPTGAIPGPA